ncbi:MAG: imidazole glycerol phosphate synthase subunit HisH [Gammaproteobacteria bacterium]|jgi:glutamine amidotransferase|nr:imidazole glycerol phosphate synthase subunit HisH [Gammaproteobacteria bacterium]
MAAVRDVVIVGSGGANIASLTGALGRLGVDAPLSTDVDEIRAAGAVILPGVGAAADAMARLRSFGLTELLPALEQPVLGICLGMQLLAAGSEEDDAECLGVIPGRALRLPASPALPVPHMGWNRVRRQGDSVLLRDVPDGAHFYFIHSYALPVAETTTGHTGYGTEFTAVFESGNFFATQFHPERSSVHGATVLKNFLEYAL